MTVELGQRSAAGTSTPRRSEPGRREAGIAGLVALAVSGGYVAIAWAHGAVGVARNDDWAYYRIAYHLARHGAFVLDGWVEAMFTGQAFLAWPVIRVFGPEIAPLQVGAAVLSAVGLWAVYLVIRGLLPVGWSALAAGCLALGPVYATLSVSFMTDMPAFAFQALALLAGLRALRPKVPSVPWVIASLGLGFVAFSIREYAATAGLAVCAVALRRSRSLDRTLTLRLAAITGAWVVMLVALFVWRRGLADSISPQLDLSPGGIASSVGTVWLVCGTLALFIAPALLAVSPRRLISAVWTRARRGGVVVAAASVVLAAAVVAIPRRGFLGNYFQLRGSYAVSIVGAHPAVLAGWIWTVLRLVGFASLVAMGLLAALRGAEKRREARDPRPARSGEDSAGLALVRVFCVLTVSVALIAVLPTDAPFYDRYLIALVPFAAALAVRTALDAGVLNHRSRVAAAALLVALGLVGLAFVDSAATLDGAKWRIGREVQAQGISAASIDAGYEWFGYHHSAKISRGDPIEGRGFWLALFGERPTCAIVTLRGAPGTVGSAPGTRPRLIRRLTVHSLMGIEYRLEAVEAPNSCPVRAEAAQIGR